MVLFNIGGPDNLAAVRPFLYNLFSDPAIITLPTGLRQLLAGFLAWRRAPIAREIYGQIGGKSPINEETRAQALALEDSLNSSGEENTEFRCFTVMRYWHPRAREVVQQVKDFSADEILLLPLFPQYSTTTTGTALDEWARITQAAKLDIPTHSCCCYPLAEGFIEAHTTAVKNTIEEKIGDQPFRLLLSAHGLPQKIVDAGDPYAWQVEQTAAAVIKRLQEETGRENIDYVVCYQSRVGPLKWLEPDTMSEIDRAGREGLPVILLPIAFVSEHSETLVELDIEYAKLAAEAGVPSYHRIPALGTNQKFIAALARITVERLNSGGCGSANNRKEERLCPSGLTTCYLNSQRKGG